MSIQAKREQLTALAKKVQQLLKDTEGKKWTPENQAAYDADMEQIDALKADIDRHQAVLDAFREEADEAAIDDAAARKLGKTSPARALFNKLLRNGLDGMNAEERKAIQATLSTTTPSQGGYTVPTEVASEIIDTLKAYGGVRAVATVLKTEGGNDYQFPTSDGSAEVGELIAQNATATAADPTFGAVVLSVYKFSSKVVAVPYELLQDAAVDVEAFIRKRLATRVFRITNQFFTTGTGTAQPMGLVTAAGVGKTGLTGQTTSVIADDLIDLVHSVDPAYRALGNCGFMMNDQSLKVIRKLKDSAGRPIFIPGYDGLAGKMADTILGYPVTVNPDMAVMAANAKSIAFGDLANYTVRDVMDPVIKRFDDSAYAKLGQVGFLQWSRHGGALLDVNAVKLYQNSAT